MCLYYQIKRQKVLALMSHSQELQLRLLQFLLLAASSVVVAGVIAFVGILVPHIARRLVGYDHKVLIPFTALLGAFIILLADTLGRTSFVPMEIPASTIMVIIGGPFLIFLLRKE